MQEEKDRSKKGKKHASSSHKGTWGNLWPEGARRLAEARPRHTHLLPSFEWDPSVNKWYMMDNAAPSLGMSEAAKRGIDPIVLDEMPPAPRYKVGQRISFPWEGHLWCGTIQRILVRGIYSYFTVKDDEGCECEEEAGARSRALCRSYYQPKSIEYVVWSHGHTRYVQAHTIIEQVYGDEEEVLSSSVFEEEVF